MSMDGLGKLKVWVKAKDFVLKIYKKVLPVLPAEEKWSLGGQLRRSAVSIPANIAEGAGRFYYQDHVRFCYIARGSLEETLSHLAIASETGMIPAALFADLSAEAEEIEKMLNGYIAFLKKSKRGANEPGALHSIAEESQPYETEPMNDYSPTP